MSGTGRLARGGKGETGGEDCRGRVGAGRWVQGEWRGTIGGGGRSLLGRLMGTKGGVDDGHQ